MKLFLSVLQQTLLTLWPRCRYTWVAYLGSVLLPEDGVTACADHTKMCCQALSPWHIGHRVPCPQER